MREARCAVHERRLDLEGPKQEAQAVHKVEGGDFDPDEGFEWPFPEKNGDGEEVVVR